MDLINVARSIGGLLSIVTLLGLVVAQFLYPSLNLAPNTVGLLLLLIGALLGVDVLVEQKLPNIQITTEKGEEKKK